MLNIEGIFWCGLFFILGPSLILLNNYILNKVVLLDDPTCHFRYPILLSSLGMFGTFIFTRIGNFFKFLNVANFPTWDYWLTRILPIGLLSAATMGTGNSVYLHLSVSFTQMLKALTPVYILMCLVLFKVEIPTTNVIFSVCVISIGTIIASFGEINFSWNGFILQSLADLFEGSRLVLLQILVGGTSGFSPIESLYHLAPATAMCQLAMIFLYERSALTSPKTVALICEYKLVFITATLLGIAINFIGMCIYLCCNPFYRYVCY